jgi:UDP-N-acetylglucosamine--N-acetylmuramyl-(pentapeptide) pyrophosphoryl-undecaprenol N-acetylglucosamine transferase
VIFIPSPNVAEDHQTKNALAVTKEDAALMIKESDLENFMSVLENLIKNEAKQNILKINFKKMALPNATSQIVDVIEKLILKYYVLITLATMAI